MRTDYDCDLEEFSLRLSLAGIRPSEELLHAAAFEFTELKRHIARLNEAAVRLFPLDTPEAHSDEKASG